MRRHAVIGLVSVLLGVVVSVGVGAQQNDTLSVKDTQIVSVGRLRYPSIAVSARVQGTVVVTGVLDDRGAVTEAVALSGSKGVQSLLMPYAVDSVRTWTFTPNAQKRFVVVLDFRLEGGCRAPGEAQVRLLANLVRVTSCAPVLF